MMNKQTKTIIAVITISVLIVVFGVLWVAYNRYQEVSGNLESFPEKKGFETYLFETDTENNKIIFLNFSYNGDEKPIWENMVVSKGNATLPSGIINRGDEITNCFGYVCLKWKPTNTTLSCSEFT